MTKEEMISLLNRLTDDEIRLLFSLVNSETTVRALRKHPRVREMLNKLK